jgi:hypothetical protein
MPLTNTYPSRRGGGGVVDGWGPLGRPPSIVGLTLAVNLGSGRGQPAAATPLFPEK